MEREMGEHRSCPPHQEGWDQRDDEDPNEK